MSKEVQDTDQQTSIVNLDNANSLPDLSEAQEVPMDLMSEYWTPEEEGETKRVFFDRVETVSRTDQDTGEVSELECAFFYENGQEGIRSVYSASVRLVALFKERDLPRGSAYKITYQGKKKNATNSFSSDRWQVRPLKVN